MEITPSQLAAAMGCALILLVVIIACANFISRFGRQQAAKRAAGKPLEIKDLMVPLQHFILLRVLLDEKEHASLSSFQFLMWTLLISFLYATLWFLQFLNRIPGSPPDISPDLMVLMGISVAVPISSRVIDIYKEVKPRQEGEEYKSPDYASMLEENGQPSLLRFQMFLWTLAALAIYFGLFVTGIMGQGVEIGKFGLPPINETFLFLMGLSQAGYLGSKAFAGKVEPTGKVETKETMAGPAATGTELPKDPAPAPMSIREIIPRDTIRSKELVTILGSGFGRQTDTIIFGQDRIDPGKITKWENERIEFSLPENLKPGAYQFRVVTGGASTSGQITISQPPVRHGFNNVDADILGEIWIDDPSMKGYRIPPIGHFIPDNMYHFFFEFAVPPGTDPWGMTQFRAHFLVNGKEMMDQSFMPGHMGGKNYGVFDYRFRELGTYKIEIKGADSPKFIDVVVKPGNP
jgi:hypothetical protein